MKKKKHASQQEINFLILVLEAGKVQSKNEVKTLQVFLCNDLLGWNPDSVATASTHNKPYHLSKRGFLLNFS